MQIIVHEIWEYSNLIIQLQWLWAEIYVPYGIYTSNGIMCKLSQLFLCLCLSFRFCILVLTSIGTMQCQHTFPERFHLNWHCWFMISLFCIYKWTWIHTIHIFRIAQHFFFIDVILSSFKRVFLTQTHSLSISLSLPTFLLFKPLVFNFMFLVFFFSFFVCHSQRNHEKKNRKLL